MLFVAVFKQTKTDPSVYSVSGQNQFEHAYLTLMCDNKAAGAFLKQNSPHLMRCGINAVV